MYLKLKKYHNLGTKNSQRAWQEVNGGIFIRSYQILGDLLDKRMFNYHVHSVPSKILRKKNEIKKESLFSKKNLLSYRIHIFYLQK